MSTVIFHGIRASEQSPKAAYPGAELWIVTRAVSKYWNGDLDWDRCFDVHTLGPLKGWPGSLETRADTIDWYRKEPAGGRPIYMQEHFADIPASVAYPLASVQKRFAIDEGNGHQACKIFGCSIDFLFALAMFEFPDLKRIVLNGVGLSRDVSHLYVHRTVLYWMGLARGRGIQVIVEGERDGIESCYANNAQEIYGYEKYGYDDLEASRAFARGELIEPRHYPQAAPFVALIDRWKMRAHGDPNLYPAELEDTLKIAIAETVKP